MLLWLACLLCNDWAGGPISTVLVLHCGMILLSGWNRGNKVFIVSLSAVLAIGGYLLFVVLFERHFPKGPFEYAFTAMMKAMGGS